LHKGIELDLGNFDKVSVDADANTLTIGAAVRFRDVVGPLGKAKKELRGFPFLVHRLPRDIDILTLTKPSAQSRASV
jgi:hypothetical protein